MPALEWRPQPDLQQIGSHALFIVAVLCSICQFAQAQVPALSLEHVEYIGQQYKYFPIGTQTIRVPSTDTIHLMVVLKPLVPGVEQLGLRTEAPPPADPENRVEPPPNNISFVVRRIDSQGSWPVPFKVSSSGASGDQKRLDIFADLEIDGNATIRHRMAREHAARFLADWRVGPLKDQPLPKQLQEPKAADHLAQTLEELLVFIPPGKYEITAVFTPKEGTSLTSKPARFLVYAAKYATFIFGGPPESKTSK